MVIAFASMFVGVLICIMGIVVTPQDWKTTLVVFGVAAAFFLYGFNRFMKIRKNNKISRECGYKKNYKKVTEFQGVALYGLNEEANCKVSMYQNNIVFKVNNHESNLKVGKITSALLKESSEITGASAGSVVAGGLLFGTLGALIAARPKNSVSYVLIINYISDEPKAIAVAAEKSQKPYMEIMVRELNRNAPSVSETEL